MPARVMFGAGLVHLSWGELERLKREGWIDTPPAPVRYFGQKYKTERPFTEARLEAVRELYRRALKDKL